MLLQPNTSTAVSKATIQQLTLTKTNSTDDPEASIKLFQQMASVWMSPVDRQAQIEEMENDRLALCWCRW
ncbi:hypothetical protein KOW79_018777 [Hemibagrus wyckioides]|uniref:Uncharacterized protein n=1 Tax=Hemibagrus wyckioides TaxID=337641 RepID=A0A9D3N8T5_9TELE|nr:hypothetical protein KOW79_018777 [Hemibagrus wyckioides]